jgi:hypothetical protein
MRIQKNLSRIHGVKSPLIPDPQHCVVALVGTICSGVTKSWHITQLMTALHVLLLQGKKSAEDTLQTLKLLMDHGLRDLINEPDSLGNTPLHALIVR